MGGEFGGVPLAFNSRMCPSHARGGDVTYLMFTVEEMMRIYHVRPFIKSTTSEQAHTLKNTQSSYLLRD